jgi:hypothetical protein
MTWRVGTRVCRKEDADEVGTVTQRNRNNLKVKWDSGQTSYYRHDDPPPLSGYTDPVLEDGA